jgi:hypothetical protein
VRTIIVGPTLESVAVLGVIVIIRIALSFSLEVEIEGAWRWRRRRVDARLESDPQDTARQAPMGARVSNYRARVPGRFDWLSAIRAALSHS